MHTPVSYTHLCATNGKAVDTIVMHFPQPSLSMPLKEGVPPVLESSAYPDGVFYPPEATSNRRCDQLKCLGPLPGHTHCNGINVFFTNNHQNITYPCDLFSALTLTPPEIYRAANIS